MFYFMNAMEGESSDEVSQISSQVIGFDPPWSSYRAMQLQPQLFSTSLQPSTFPSSNSNLLDISHPSCLHTHYQMTKYAMSFLSIPPNSEMKGPNC